jgi:protein SCO1
MRRRITGLFLLALLAACGAETSRQPALTLKGTDISSATEFTSAAAPGGVRLALTDHDDRPVTLDSFQGKLVVLFFGYTHCPDVCPTTLADMARALQLLPAEDAEQVRVLFVSVDPERDTAEVLKAYVPYFHPDFLGLRGTPEQVAQAAREFRIVYRKHVEPGASDYLIDHSAGSYILDARGRLRVYLPFASPPEDIAHDLAALLRAG